MKLQGKDLLLYIGQEGGGYTLVGLSTSCEIDVTADMKDVSSLLTGRHRSVRPGRYSWQVSCDALVDPANTMTMTLLECLCQGRRLTVTTNIRVGQSEHRVNGQVYVSSWRETAPLGSMVTYSVTLVGSSPLKIFGGSMITNE